MLEFEFSIGGGGSPVPFRLYVPSGRLSGPILKPERCFLGFEESASSSRGLLGAIVELEDVDVPCCRGQIVPKPPMSKSPKLQGLLSNLEASRD